MDAAGSQLKAPERSQSAERLAAELEEAAKIAAVERFDNFAHVRNSVGRLALEQGHWAGIPMPIEDEQLVVEPSYPFAHVFNERAEPRVVGKKASEFEDYKFVNSWYSKRYRSTVAVFKNSDGHAKYAINPTKPIDLELRTMGCSVAWGIAQEQRALQLLGTMLKHHMFKYYLLSGMFIESSKRSGVTYLFRKLRPTIAIKAYRDHMRPLAALCMHAVGYYSGSWAGAMCPTDDVIAHLAMMRGDEHMFWRRCNQHNPFSKEAGL